jgi:hypothetical protein
MSEKTKSLNVLGEPLELCCSDPMTGFFRDGFCQTGPRDLGSHTVCAQVTQEFLDFTASKGNNLSSPVPEYCFPGLKPGDNWCLCVRRWKEAYMAGVYVPVRLEATEISALKVASLDELSLKMPV